MNQKEFILDVIVNKLEWNDDPTIDTKNLLVKFSFDDIQLDITTSRINVADFGEGRSVEFTSTLDQLKKRLKEFPLQLTIIKPNAVIADEVKAKSGQSLAGDDDAEKSKSIDKSMTVDGGLGTNVIGTVSCNWPPALIEKLKDNCTAVVPYIQVCEIRNNEEQIGKITLGVMLHCKCDANPTNSLTNKQPFINERGILTAFDNISKEIEKNDVFFVIGQKPDMCQEPALGPFQDSSSCARKPKYPARLDTSRYKFIRGTLIPDCNALGEGRCSVPDCCSSRYQPPPAPPIRNQRFEINNTNCCRCEDFSNSTPIVPRVRRRSTAKEASSSCSKKQVRCRLQCGHSEHSEIGEQKDLSPAVLLTKIYEERLAQYEREEENFRRPTEPPKILPPRFCPKCCKNLTMMSKKAACPNCGYKPPSKMIYNTGETADDIADQWDADEKTFLDNQGFNKFDHCTCHERGDRKDRKKCLYCRIRAIRKEITDHSPQLENPFAPRKPPILSDSDRESKNDKDKLAYDEIIATYAADSEDTSPPRKTWKGLSTPPRLSLVMDRLKKRECCEVKNPKKESRNEGSLSSKKNHSEKSKDRANVKNGSKKPSDACLSREERIRKMMNTLCEPEPLKKEKPKTLKEFAKEMKRKYGRRYCYPKRKRHLNPIANHNHCVPESFRVPANMGWLWNRNSIDAQRGWRPGKIRRPIRELMEYFLTEFPVDSLPTTQEMNNLVRPPPEPEPEEELVQKPTIRIQKRNGQYLVTMYPLKTEKELQHSADPYAKTDPIQFKIAKDPIAMKRRQVKRYLKEIGFQKCTCQKPISKCTCRSYMEKEQLDFSLNSILEVIQATSLRDAIALSDTTESDSELNIEFTPPAGVIKPHLKTKPDNVEICTQYDFKDITTDHLKRTPIIIRQEARKKKKHNCAGPIESEPCGPKMPIRKFQTYRKKKQPTLDKSKELSKASMKNKSKDIKNQSKELSKASMKNKSKDIKNQSKELKSPFTKKV